MGVGHRRSGAVLRLVAYFGLALLGACSPAPAPPTPTASKPAAAATAPITAAPPAKPTAAGTAAVSSTAAAQVPAPAPTATGPTAKLVVGTLAFPSLIEPIFAVVEQQKLGAKHGLDIELKRYGNIAPYQAAFGTGEIDTSAGGPHLAQRQRLDGVPVQILTTLAEVSAMGVVTARDDLASISALRGKKLAADMSSSEFQILSLYGRANGLDLVKDATVIQAALPQARAMLQTGEADASLVWEPVLTQTLADNAANHLLVSGADAWHAVSNTTGWEVVVQIRQDYAERNPEAVKRWVMTLEEAADFIGSNPSAADEIVLRDVNLPAGTFARAVEAKRLVYRISPAEQPENREALNAMFKAAVDIGYLPRLPDDKIIYAGP